ncbi:hypothetical protein Trydic_g8499 [Trypoxylus dichotomus]
MSGKSRTVTFRERPRTATIVLDLGIAATTIDHLSGPHCVVVELNSGAGRWVLVNQYYQFEDPVHTHLEKTDAGFREFADVPAVLAADVNAKSVMWNSPYNDERGEDLQLLVQELGLQVENSPGGPPTFEGRAGAAFYIDVTFSDSERP